MSWINVSRLDSLVIRITTNPRPDYKGYLRWNISTSVPENSDDYNFTTEFPLTQDSVHTFHIMGHWLLITQDAGNPQTGLSTLFKESSFKGVRAIQDTRIKATVTEENDPLTISLVDATGTPLPTANKTLKIQLCNSDGNLLQTSTGATEEFYKHNTNGELDGSYNIFYIHDSSPDTNIVTTLTNIYDTYENNPDICFNLYMDSSGKYGQNNSSTSLTEENVQSIVTNNPSFTEFRNLVISDNIVEIGASYCLISESSVTPDENLYPPINANNVLVNLLDGDLETKITDLLLGDLIVPSNALKICRTNYAGIPQATSDICSNVFDILHGGKAQFLSLADSSGHLIGSSIRTSDTDISLAYDGYIDTRDHALAIQKLHDSSLSVNSLIVTPFQNSDPVTHSNPVFVSITSPELKKNVFLSPPNPIVNTPCLLYSISAVNNTNIGGWVNIYDIDANQALLYEEGRELTDISSEIFIMRIFLNQYSSREITLQYPINITKGIYSTSDFGDLYDINYNILVEEDYKQGNYDIMKFDDYDPKTVTVTLTDQKTLLVMPETIDTETWDSLYYNAETTIRRNGNTVNEGPPVTSLHMVFHLNNNGSSTGTWFEDTTNKFRIHNMRPALLIVKTRESYSDNYDIGETVKDGITEGDFMESYLAPKSFRYYGTSHQIPIKFEIVSEHSYTVTYGANILPEAITPQLVDETTVDGLIYKYYTIPAEDCQEGAEIYMEFTTNRAYITPIPVTIT